MSDYDTYRDESGDIDHTDQEVLESLYWDEELSFEGIAEVVGLSPGGVQYWMEKHEIETRDRGEAQRDLVAGFTHNSEGYEMWAVSEGGVLVSRILAVAEYGFDAVVGNEVHHENGVPWDNRPENITIRSPRDHRQDHGKLSRDDVREMKHRLNNGGDKHELADCYGVDVTTVNDIIAGRSWSNIEP